MLKEYHNLNCVYRDWRQAPSAKSYLHGYCLSVNVGFENDDNLDEFEKWLNDTFDHTVIVTYNDPFGALFAGLPSTTARVVNVENVGAQAFAEMIYNKFAAGNPSVTSVEVIEHGANHAIYEG